VTERILAGLFGPVGLETVKLVLLKSTKTVRKHVIKAVGKTIFDVFLGRLLFLHVSYNTIFIFVNRHFKFIYFVTIEQSES